MKRAAWLKCKACGTVDKTKPGYVGTKNVMCRNCCPTGHCTRWTD